MRFYQKQIAAIIVIITLSILLLPAISFAGNYPKDGVFKQLPESRDAWFYVDKNNWEIKAPDKWTHMMGSYSSSALLGKIMNKYAAGALIFTFGLYKEYDDAYREGWSYRDIIADAIGVSSSLFSNQRFSLLANYDYSSVILQFSYTF